MSNENCKSRGFNVGKKQTKNVAIHSIGICTAMDPLEWPSGEFLKKNISSISGSAISPSKASHCHEDFNPEGIYSSNLDARYWQAAARHALITKHDCSIPFGSSAPIQSNEIELVQHRWEELVNNIRRKSSSNASETVTNGIDNSGDLGMKSYVASDYDECDNLFVDHRRMASSINMDITDFIVNRCCISNNRQMEWSVISCPPGVQFQLHAHPNIELIYCIRGALYEVRMNGPPISRFFEEHGADGEDEKMSNVSGPELTHTQRSWSFGSLKEAQWLVNEVGSIHKSFTSSKSDGGCDLLVLWGGSHANIHKPPVTPNIQKAVDLMDDRLKREFDTKTDNVFCCSETNENVISTTFLPESEKSGAF